MCSVRVYSKDLVEDLISNNVVPSKSYSNTFPVIEDEKLFFHFLRGYIDGDGCYSVISVETSKRVVNYPRITIAGNNKDCFDYIIRRLKKHNIEGHILKDGNNYKLEVSQKQSCKNLIEKLYSSSNISLDRKSKKSKKLINL